MVSPFKPHVSSLRASNPASGYISCVPQTPRFPASSSFSSTCFTGHFRYDWLSNRHSLPSCKRDPRLDRQGLALFHSAFTSPFQTSLQQAKQTSKPTASYRILCKNLASESSVNQGAVAKTIRVNNINHNIPIVAYASVPPDHIHSRTQGIPTEYSHPTRI